MPEETEYLEYPEYNSDEERLSQAQMKNRRNIANNTQAAKVAADIASKSGHPLASAIGTGVKAADKLTGGKASEMIGKGINNANKFNPGGRAAQKAINKMMENGTASRLGKAMSKKKQSKAPNLASMKGNAVADKKSEASSFDKREVEEQVSDGGGASFDVSIKFIKTALIAFIPIMVVVIFMNLIVSGSQTYIKVIGLDHADSTASSKADQKIRDKASQDLLNEEITDENAGSGVSALYEFGDIYLTNSQSASDISVLKLSRLNSNDGREYSEADLSELEDYYSDINSYGNGNYNMDTVYKFFFKLMYIQNHYKKAYNVDLDMPLLMSILNIQSTDISEVFVSNIEEYTIGRKENNPDFKYDASWAISAGSSAHDIEILAQNMVSRNENSTCPTVDNACYSIVDEATYREFLKTFLSQKYFNGEQNANINNLIIEIYDAKQQYDDLAGKKVDPPTIVPASNNSFWWPIGSMETEEINGVLYAKGAPATIHVTSSFGDQESFRASAHGGIDIGNAGNGPGVLNVIAVKAGEVIYPTSKAQTQYPDNGYYGNPDGGGFGNYVKIKHSDGTYTLYAHLAQNSITVMAGDVVDQGQVIGKMGHSGSSTGTHLHFEVRIGSDTRAGRVFPLDYIDPENPRPVSTGSGSNFSLTGTSLSKEEFVARMIDYYERTGNVGFKNNFLSKAESIYDVSLQNNVNPELVVVTAGTEQSWTLSSACQYTNNYWGIGIPNGKGCNAGPKFDSIEQGIVEYAKLLTQYSAGGKYSNSITNKYNERAAAGCSSDGHGLPGTLEGMQSIYSWIGNFRYNPGSSGSGGCYYFDYIYGKGYCSSVPTCSSKVATNSCPEESRTTVCEQNDYTAWQLKKKFQVRYDIFGL